MNYFCELLNVRRVWCIKQTEIQTAGPFVPELSSSKFEDAIGKFKRFKLAGADQIPAELIQAGREEILHSEIYKLIKLIWNKEELPQ
jgi:hypothetical protein